MANPRALGLAHLSLLDHDPPALVDLAADAGFDFVGIRVRAVTPAETPFDVSPGSDLLKATRHRLDDRGIRCADIEFVLLDGIVGPADWRPVLESGAELGAQTLTVSINDPDDARAADHVAAMTAEAATYPIGLTIEPISYNTVSSLEHARRLAEHAGCRVLLDALHVTRVGATADQIRAVAPLVVMLQLCDGPVPGPRDRPGRIQESRVQRMPPGDGAFDLATLMPISLEVPSATARASLSPLQYATRLRVQTRELLTSLAAQDSREGGRSWVG
jgi:sugar phosphate isomerase/epimerase